MSPVEIGARNQAPTARNHEHSDDDQADDVEEPEEEEDDVEDEAHENHEVYEKNEDKGSHQKPIFLFFIKFINGL